MDNMLMKTLTLWQKTLASATLVNIGLLSSRKRDLQRSVARNCMRLTLATLCVTGVQSNLLWGNDGCSCDSQARFSTCKHTKPHSILGNGLLDYLNKATGPIGPDFYRSRSSRASCDSGCDQGCDGCGSGFKISNVSSSSSGNFGSMSQNHSGSTPNSQHSYDAEHSHLDNYSSGHSSNMSPVPMPIPDPIASPPTKQIQAPPSPGKNGPGNPFLDEARNTPSPVKRSTEALAGSSSRRTVATQKTVTTQKAGNANTESDDFIHIPVSVSSTPFSPSIRKQEVVVKKASVKSSPRVQYKFNPVDQSIQDMDTKLNPPVITAGSIERAKMSEAKFAR